MIIVAVFHELGEESARYEAIMHDAVEQLNPIRRICSIICPYVLMRLVHVACIAAGMGQCKELVLNGIEVGLDCVESDLC